MNILFCIFRDVNIGVEGVRQIQGDKVYLVKYKENNPRAVGGIEVRGIKDVSDFHTPVIVGVSDRFREEVVEELVGRGFKNILELKF